MSLFFSFLLSLEILFAMKEKKDNEIIEMHIIPPKKFIIQFERDICVGNETSKREVIGA